MYFSANTWTRLNEKRLTCFYGAGIMDTRESHIYIYIWTEEIKVFENYGRERTDVPE